MRPVPPRLRDEPALLGAIKAIHDAIRAEVVAACARASADELAAVTGKQAGDVIYAVDRLSERVLLSIASRRLAAQEWPCLLVAEGLGADGRRMLPEGTPEADAEIVAIVDPIDGTRGLMYQKRPAWVLTGDRARTAAAARRWPTSALAVQTEIPLYKQRLADTLWAVAGEGAHAERFDLASGTRAPLALRPSTGDDGRARLRRPREVLLGHARRAGGHRRRGRAPVARRGSDDGDPLVFDDEYLTSAGQLYELTIGHDRWIADLRPLLHPRPARARPRRHPVRPPLRSVAAS